MPPASPSTARALNDRLALELLQEHGPLSASQLTTLTGLARPTVADLIQRLGENGLITPAGESGANRRGPNARLYGIAADRAHLAALDMRADSVRVLVADLLGTTLAEGTLPVDALEKDWAAKHGAGTHRSGTHGSGKHGAEVGARDRSAEAVRRSAELLDQVMKDAGVRQLHSVAVGAPGMIDAATARLRTSTGLVWHHEVIALLQQRLTAAVRIENESNLAALAEQRQGVARGRDSFILFWLGEGPGAAVVLDGKLRNGASGGAGRSAFCRCRARTGCRRPRIVTTDSTPWSAAPPCAASPRSTASARSTVSAPTRASLLNRVPTPGRAPIPRTVPTPR